MTEHSRYKTPQGDIVKVYYDPDPEQPLETMDDTKFFAIHRRYELIIGGYNFISMSELLKSMIETYVPESYRKRLFNKSENPDFVDDIISFINKYAYVLPVYLYDHSGLCLSTSPFSCPWDSGQVGFVAIRKKDWSIKDGNWVDYLNSIIKVQDYYINGNVFGFIKETEDGEWIDYCWGYIGDDFKENGLYDAAGVKYSK